MILPELNKIYLGSALEVIKTWPANFVQTCITSPPYFNLRSYLPEGHPDKSKEIGLESSPKEFIDNLVSIFHEVKRVLRDDGTCWINISDSYSGSMKGKVSNGYVAGKLQKGNKGSIGLAVPDWKALGVGPKNLLGIPWKLAFALQDDGWTLRQDVIWSKASCMPESVKDRCTRSHEYVFMLTKNSDYFYDNDAIKEESVIPEGTKMAKGSEERLDEDGVNARPSEYWEATGFRNKRSVWTINPEPIRDAHYAHYPQALVTPCVLAGTSAHGACKECMAPWQRTEDGEGWEATCRCKTDAVVPCVCLDPFSGSGTTSLVALKNKRNFIGCELNPEYIKISDNRLFDEIANPRFI